jgi:hypothetical protein
VSNPEEFEPNRPRFFRSLKEEFVWYTTLASLPKPELPIPSRSNRAMPSGPTLALGSRWLPDKFRGLQPQLVAGHGRSNDTRLSRFERAQT